MNVVVNFALKNNTVNDKYSDYMFELWKTIATEQEQHRFYFISDSSFRLNNSLPANIELVITKTNLSTALQAKWWFDYSLPKQLKNINADIVVQAFGIVSSKIKQQQLLMLHDLDCIEFSEQIDFGWRLFCKNNFNKILQNNYHIIVSSEALQQRIAKEYKRASAKMDVVHILPSNIFQPLAIFNQQNVKEKYAESNEYFLFVGGNLPQNHLMNVLKAFSIFKKRQQSSMKLLITGSFHHKHDAVIDKINTFKYRNDVVVLDEISTAENASIVASAYAILLPGNSLSASNEIRTAIQCEVPMIICKTGAAEEIGGNAVSYIESAEPQVIADRLFLLYRDETYRNQLIRLAQEQAKTFSIQEVAQQVWNILGNRIYQ
jgi:glycosyltransferase involved in cell wall biosynthesis